MFFFSRLQFLVVTPLGSVLKHKRGLGPSGSPEPDKLTLKYQMEGYIE